MTAAVQLQEIAQVIRGVSFDKEDVLDEGRDGYWPVLRAGNIGTDLLIDQDLVWVPESRIGDEQRLRAGDIAICMSSGSHTVVGKTATLRSDWTGSVGAFCAIVRPRPGTVLPDWLSFFLHSEVFRTWTRQSPGANIKNIRKSELEAFPVPLPAFDEQQRIVDLLSRAEGIVRLRRQAQQKAAGLISAMFVDMFGDPVTNPKGWPFARLVEVLSAPIRNGISPSRSGRIPGKVLTLSSITHGEFDEASVKEANFAAPIASGDEVRAVDFLVCRGNGNRTLVGAGCFPMRDMSGVAFPDTAIAVRPDPAVVNPAYFSALWRTAFIRQQIDSIAKTTNGTFKINQKGLAGIRIPVPRSERQSEFSRRAEALLSIQSQQAVALQKATATFEALRARAFSVQRAADVTRKVEGAPA